MGKVTIRNGKKSNRNWKEHKAKGASLRWGLAWIAVDELAMAKKFEGMVKEIELKILIYNQCCAWE